MAGQQYIIIKNDHTKYQLTAKLLMRFQTTHIIFLDVVLNFDKPGVVVDTLVLFLFHLKQ